MLHQFSYIFYDLEKSDKKDKIYNNKESKELMKDIISLVVKIKRETRNKIKIMAAEKNMRLPDYIEYLIEKKYNEYKNEKI